MLELSAPVIAIVGPTASGKTDAAQIVAERLGGEVVSADSMQIYRGMDIGTGKLPASERRVPHHGFDLVDPGEPYSAALFQAFARRCFRDIDARGKRAVLCGGTGQYVQAAIDDFAFPKGDQVENPVRERWTAYAEEHGNQALWEALEARDPASAAVIHPNNVRRVVRAFELLEEGGSYAEQKQRLATVAPFVPAVQLGLAVEPAILNERIDARVDAMVAAGLVDEVRGLLSAGFRDGVTAHQAIGYKEFFPYFEQTAPLEACTEKLKQASRNYAKRQLTWFRHMDGVVWLDASAPDVTVRAVQLTQEFLAKG